MQDNKNFIAAMVLSVMVLLGWQFFFAEPQIEQTRQQQAEQTAAPQPGAPTPSGGELPAATSDPGIPLPSASTPAGTPTPSEPAAATDAAGRVAIDSGRLSGSINMRGGRIDDLKLKEYRTTREPGAPNIVLLSPSTAAGGYFAEFGWISADSSVPTPGPETVWQAAAGATLTPTSPVELTWDNGAGLVFTRTVAVDDQYMFTVSDTVANGGAAAVALQPYGRVVRIGTPETTGFFILHEGPIGVLGGGGLREYDYDEIVEGGPIAEPTVESGWLGFTDKYWATAMVPEAGLKFDGRFVSFPRDNQIYQADFRGEPMSIAPDASIDHAVRLFAGAKVVSMVDGYQEAFGIPQFDLLIDWGWFYFITKPMFYALDWFFHLFGNFGLSILAVTVIIKLIFFPLANKSYKSMSAMKKLQPKMVELRERYKDDRVKQQQAMMEMYKTEKVNPVAGCWPVALQIPVFFALYKVLFITIEMRHAPFFGWIQDLSAPDPTTIFNLFGLIAWTPPEFLMLGIWPLIMGVTMWLQMRLNPTPPDPTQAMIFNWMPVIFTFMLARFPAGLVIYWTWNNTLSILQQTVIMHRQGVKIELWDNVKSTLRKKPASAKSDNKS